MKKTVIHISLALTLLTGFSLQSCKPKDSDILASFNEKAKSNEKLRNVTATVNDGILTLNGQCVDQTCFTEAEREAEGIKGVKSVKNNITVVPPEAAPLDQAPVTVNNDATIRTSANQILQRFPNVTADVQNGRVVLRGTVKSREEMQQVIMAFNEANIRSFDNQITVK